jgi:putative aldouronate transport system substrate-binding protein
VAAVVDRRSFLALSAAGATTLAGCSKRARSDGSASNARRTAEVVPKLIPKRFVEPDVPGEGPIPDGYLRYPRELVRAVTRKPGSSGRTIKTMTAAWGPAAPGLGRNAYLDAVNATLGVPIDPSVQDGNTYAAKLSAILGARDVPDLLSVPSWEVGKIPRFSQAVKALFEDLTDYLRGDAVSAYPILATLPTEAWQHAVWGGRLAAVPCPSDGVVPLALFYRKDLTDAAGVAAPANIDELYRLGKAMTNPSKGVWAFGDIFYMVQMFFKCPGAQTGWRKKASGGLEHKYETKEYRLALETTARFYREGFVHPDVIATKGADAKTLFSAGRIIALQDGVGAWRGMQSEQAKITPGFDMQPVPLFSALGGEPSSWPVEGPIFYTFVKKGVGKPRVEELLRVLDWCSCPFGTLEYELREYGVEGKHFTRAPDHSPVQTPLGRKEIQGQCGGLGGRVPSVVGTADTPNYVNDLLAFTRNTFRYVEKNPFAGLKLEYPANYSKILVTTEDKVADVVRGRRPLSDLDQIVREWRATGGDEGRSFFEKALADNGR